MGSVARLSARFLASLAFSLLGIVPSRVDQYNKAGKAETMKGPSHGHLDYLQTHLVQRCV